MDLASKTKEIKQEVKNLESEKMNSQNRIKELQAALAEKKKVQKELEELRAKEAELLAELGA